MMITSVFFTLVHLIKHCLTFLSGSNTDSLIRILLVGN